MPERLIQPDEWFRISNFRRRAKPLEGDPHTKHVTQQIKGLGRVEVLTRWEDDKQIYAHSGPFLVYDGQAIIRIEGNPDLLQSIEDLYPKDLLDLTVNMHRSRLVKVADWEWHLRLPLADGSEMVLSQLSEQSNDEAKAGMPGFPTSNWIISGSNNTVGEVFVLGTDEALENLHFKVVRIR